MGTRHLIMVKSEGETKVAQYGQWDGYPTGQGKDIAQWLHSKTFNLKEFNKQVNALKFLTKKQADDFFGSPEIKSIKSDEFVKLYPEYSRDTSAALLPLIQAGKVKTLINNKAFLKESQGFSCEYAYELDLDKQTVSVYVGSKKFKTFKFKDFTPDSMDKLEDEINGENE